MTDFLTTRDAATLRTFVAYVEDRPGVLNRLTSLFRRRNYNIVSLNVGRTEKPGVSRMTFQMEADRDSSMRIEANLYKMVNVLSIEDITEKHSVIRDLCLIKIQVGAERRAEVLGVLDVFRARAVDVGPDSLTVEISGKQEKIDGLIATLSPFGILEMVQTGTVAMTRGGQGAAARVAHSAESGGIAAA